MGRAFSRQNYLFTYPVFLLSPVTSLANTNAKALMINSLVEAWSDWLTPLIGNVAPHLRRHWSQSQHILTSYLSEVSLASKGRDR